MSRSYALALIFTALSLIGGTFYGQYWYLTNEKSENEAYATEVYERVMEGQMEEIDEIVRMATDRMQDEVKYRFRPILPFLDEVLEQRDEYLSAVKNYKSADKFFQLKFLAFHNELLGQLERDAGGFLAAHGEQMDLRKKDIHSKAAILKKKIDEVKVRKLADDSWNGNRVPSLDLLAIDYLTIVRLVLHDVIDLSGGKIIGCQFGPQHFPIFNLNIENPKKGEKVLAKVWAGSYSSELQPENIILLINNDTISIKNNGIADYSFTPHKRGKLELDIELGIRNPLTGEVRRDRSKKIFNIR